MSQITARASTSIIHRTAERLGVPLPDKYQADIEAAKALVTATSEVGSQLTVADAAVAAIRDGRNLYTDKNVQRALLDQALATSGVDRAGLTRADEDTRATIIEHADIIISSWSEALDDDSTAISEAAKVLDTLDDVNVARRSKETVELWRTAVAATDRFAAALQGWGAIAGALGIISPKHQRAFILTAAVSDELPGTLESPWQIAKAGATPSLATVSEYRHRVAEHNARLHEELETANAERRRAGFSAVRVS